MCSLLVNLTPLFLVSQMLHSIVHKSRGRIFLLNTKVHFVNAWENVNSSQGTEDVAKHQHFVKGHWPYPKKQLLRLDSECSPLPGSELAPHWVWVLAASHVRLLRLQRRKQHL
uniref:Secreted protein n=1 Tax=Anguilla anguilla TaxID=7936 RepID=A0A0E9PQD5_ANGAN